MLLLNFKDTGIENCQLFDTKSLTPLIVMAKLGGNYIKFIARNLSIER